MKCYVLITHRIKMCLKWKIKFDATAKCMFSAGLDQTVKGLIIRTLLMIMILFFKYYNRFSCLVLIKTLSHYLLLQYLSSQSILTLVYFWLL